MQWRTVPEVAIVYKTRSEKLGTRNEKLLFSRRPELAILQHELIAAPGYRMSGVTSDPDH